LLPLLLLLLLLPILLRLDLLLLVLVLLVLVLLLLDESLLNFAFDFNCLRRYIQDFHASEWGAYRVKGCDGSSPVLSVMRGIEYTFLQKDATNWYAHPAAVARPKDADTHQTNGTAHFCKTQQTFSICPSLRMRA